MVKFSPKIPSIQLTSLRLWIVVSLIWPLLWIAIFDRWFFWTPLGLITTFGIPIVGWLVWWKFYEGSGEKLLHEGKLVLAKGTIALMKAKKQIAKKRVSH